MLVALVDKSTVLLASKQAWISDELAILHSVNVRHTQNTALFRTLRAPARAPCLVPRTQNTARTARFWNRAVSPAMPPPARAVSAAVSLVPPCPAPGQHPVMGRVRTSLCPLPPHAVSPLPRWQARPGATACGRSTAASPTCRRSAAQNWRRYWGAPPSPPPAPPPAPTRARLLTAVAPSAP